MVFLSQSTRNAYHELALFLLVIFIPKEGIMNTKLSIAIAVSAVLLTCSAIIGGVYVGICHGDYPVTACEVEVDKD